MLEIISMLCSIALLVATPMQTAQIRAGKINPKFKGTPEAYLDSMRKQMNYLIYLGVILGIVNLGMIFIDLDSGEWIFNLIAGALWVAVAGVAYWSRQQIANAPVPAPGPPVS